MLILRILLFLTLFSQKVLTRNPGSVIPELDNNSQWWNSWRRATQSNYYQLNHREICGIRKIVSRQRRIVGGKKTSFGQWPWQVSIKQVPNEDVDLYGFGSGSGHCGGVLLSRNWIITAAHCVNESSKNSKFVVRIGEHEFYDSLPHQDRIISKIIVHPNYDPNHISYDIALLKMASPIDFKPNAIPICLPRPNLSFDGKTGVATGWGHLFDEEVLEDLGRSHPKYFQPKILREVQLPIRSSEKCQAIYRSIKQWYWKKGDYKNTKIPDVCICAGGRWLWSSARGGSKDTCVGDSGGPLVVKSNHGKRRFLLAGITMGGMGECGENPGIYTNVSKFTSWIIQNTDY